MNEELVTDETLTVQGEDETPQNPSPADNAEVKAEVEELKKKAALAENYKIRAEKAEKALRIRPEVIKDDSPDSIDLIKLGKKLQDYSDDELDFVTEHAKSKRPDDILKALENEFIQIGIKARREKLEKERLTLHPTSNQGDAENPMSFTDKLKTGSLADKEKLLREMGLYKEVRPRTDRTNIGGGR